MIKVVAIDEDPAVGYVMVVVVNDVAAMPVISPVVPPPAKPAKKTNSEAQAERNPWAPNEQSRI
jgi:hypothetical protein